MEFTEKLSSKKLKKALPKACFRKNAPMHASNAPKPVYKALKEVYKTIRKLTKTPKTQKASPLKRGLLPHESKKSLEAL